MESGMLFVKLTILLYCVLRSIQNDGQNRTAIVLFMLIYIVVNVSLYMVKQNKFKKSLLLILILLIGSFFKFSSALFILLLPISIYELVVLFSENLLLVAAISAIPLLFLAKIFWLDYFFVGGFSCLTYFQSLKFYTRIEKLTAANDKMREKIHMLTDQLNKDVEYERQIKYSLQLEERNHIAQEIHDKLGHAIAGSLLQLEAARLYMDHNKEKSKDIIQTVIHILREGMESIRSTLKNIKPGTEQLGINRVKILMEEFSVNHFMKTSVRHTGNMERISPIQWKIIIKNIGESLTNTMKYANASAIAVHIEVLNKVVKAEIKDNGTGTPSIIKGLGIRGMEERSGNMGGKIIIDGSNGFSVITLLPLEGELHGN
ncbi:MAG: signal transduction histidine kinase [Bacilli bacterium]|nr:signal transduction histidine kinase [Bacilli bacterium]